MGKLISGVFENQEAKYCSKCGKAAVHHYELNRGYGSQFDNASGHICNFDLCDDCNEDWIEEVVNETPIIEDFGVTYPNEHKLVEFIDTFTKLSQDMIYYGYDTSELASQYNDEYDTNTYTIENDTTVDYEKLYLDFFGSEEGVKEAFEEMSYTPIYEEDNLSNE